MPFISKELDIPGLLLIEPKVFTDERGFFFEKYKQSEFLKFGIPPFVQDNYSYSTKGVIRALHYQASPHAQGKLVSVITGSIWDVAVDLRQNSPCFGKWVGVELSGENNLSLYIPPGFAHGFVALTPEVRFLYKCTEEYDQGSERGIVWNDPTLSIDWKVSNPQVSERDAKLPTLESVEKF